MIILLFYYRMGVSGDLKPDVETAQALEKTGIELLHVSSGISSGNSFETSYDFPYNQIVYSGTYIKNYVKIPITVVSDIRTLSRGNVLLEKGLCDFVAYGKPFLADEAFLMKSMENYDYNGCLNCRTCKWYTNGAKCPAQLKAVKQITHKRGL